MQTRMGGASARVLEQCFWALILVSLGFAAGAALHNEEHYNLCVYAGAASAALGLRAYVGHGGGRVTALGLFSLATVLCLSFGAVYTGMEQETIVEPRYVVIATLVSPPPSPSTDSLPSQAGKFPARAPVFGWGLFVFNMEPVVSLESMRRVAAIRWAIARAPGGAVTLLDPRPLVRVRVVYGRAVAVTPTHVLHEWVRAGEYHCRWDERWQVERVEVGEWDGEALD